MLVAVGVDQRRRLTGESPAALVADGHTGWMKLKPWEVAVLLAAAVFLLAFKWMGRGQAVPPAYMWFGLLAFMLACFYIAFSKGRGRGRRAHSNPPRADESSTRTEPPAQSGGRDGGERPGG